VKQSINLIDLQRCRDRLSLSAFPFSIYLRMAMAEIVRFNTIDVNQEKDGE
jgi:hypothetical protein